MICTCAAERQAERLPTLAKQDKTKQNKTKQNSKTARGGVVSFFESRPQSTTRLIHCCAVSKLVSVRVLHQATVPSSPCRHRLALSCSVVKYSSFFASSRDQAARLARVQLAPPRTRRRVCPGAPRSPPSRKKAELVDKVTCWADSFLCGSRVDSSRGFRAKLKTNEKRSGRGTAGNASRPIPPRGAFRGNATPTL